MDNGSHLNRAGNIRDCAGHLPGKSIAAVALVTLLTSCATTPLENAQQLVYSHEYASALELLGSVDLDTTDIHSLSLRATALFVANRLDEGFQDIARMRAKGRDGEIHAASILMQSARVAAREKLRTTDVLKMLDSAMVLDPSVKNDVIGLVWQRGIEFLNYSGDDGYRMIEYGSKLDTGFLGRLRAHDIIMARRFEEFETMYRVLPTYSEYGRRYFTEIGGFPPNLATLQAAYPEVPLHEREGWAISFDGREGKIVALATAKLGNRAGVRRGTVLIGG